MIDTHSHFYVSAFDEDRLAALERARESGIQTIVLPAIDSATHAALFAMSREHACCKPLMGLHPTSVNDNPRWREELALVEGYLKQPPGGIERFFGIGETGIDLHWSRDFLADQTEVFERHIELSLDYGLPLVIHARDAWNEVFGSLEKYAGRGLRGVLHAFSGGVGEYERANNLGDFAIGISGVVTYKRGPLDDVVRGVPLEAIVLETDCPYLTPEPHRGTRNESSYLTFIRDRVAFLRGVEAAEVERVTTENARRIFGF